MRKLKSVVKRMLGRAAPSPITIDSVSMTENGYCIVGWYASQQVSQLSLTDSRNAAIDINTTQVSRPDVQQATGQPASGFQMIATTRLPIDELSLQVLLKSGKTTQLGLTLKGEALEIENGQPVVSTSSGSVDGSCEYAIISDTHIFVIGWLMDKGEFSRARIVNSAGENLTSDSDFLRFSRKDVAEAFGANEKSRIAGFTGLFTRESTSDDIKRRTLTVEFIVNDRPVMLPIAEKVSADEDPTKNAIRVLSNWNAANPAHLEKAHIFQPIVASIFSGQKKATSHRVDFGKPVSAPKATIIVPLYGRYDFLRFQMAHFTRYDSYNDCEILYVVDDPSIELSTLKLARQLESTKCQPFSIIILSQNVGFGGANNIGASYAQADTLILMNSDIMPASAEWLSTVLATVSDESVGIVGTRLLFEDDTIQHDGMAPMRIEEYPGLYFNDHPRKGWPVSLAPSEEGPVETDLVTAALWVIKRSDYLKLGGFDPEYPLGDFEDSDLCLRLKKAGKRNVIHRDVALYHLERQSQNLVAPGKWKHNVTLLNAVTFNNKWHDYLEKEYEATA